MVSDRTSTSRQAVKPALGGSWLYVPHNRVCLDAPKRPPASIVVRGQPPPPPVGGEGAEHTATLVRSASMVSLASLYKYPGCVLYCTTPTLSLSLTVGWSALFLCVVVPGGTAAVGTSAHTQAGQLRCVS